MKRFLPLFIVLLTSCSSLNSIQETEYQAMEMEGVLVIEKSPGTAAALGLLPGCGSFYTRSFGVGIIDLLLWPYSILWDPFLAYDNAKVINYNTTRFSLKRKAKKELDELHMKYQNGELTEKEYSLKKYEIEKKYDFDS